MMPFNKFIGHFPWLLTYSGNIPQLYWDVDSDEQRYRLLCEWLCALSRYSHVLGDANNDNYNAIVELRELFENFQASGFDDYYAEQVVKWINAHLPFIYEHTIKQIYFALDDSGHLKGYIPESWDDIVFSTPLDYKKQDTYGRLVLSYELSTTASYPRGNERY